MVDIRPFRALRPQPQAAAQVACPPYDVVNTAEARNFIDREPLSFMRVIRSDAAYEGDPYDPAVYTQAKEALEALENDGVLFEDGEPSYYIYSLQDGDHVQTGVVGCAAVNDYEAGRIKIHEMTRPQKERDRTQHLIVTGVHSGPVFQAFTATDELKSALSVYMQQEPLYEVTDERSVVHRVWKVATSEHIQQLLQALPHSYIADGHHRAASACACAKEMRARNGEGPWDHFLTVLFPHDELRIMPYNRIVHSLPLAPTEFLERLRASFTVTTPGPAQPERKGEISLYLEGKWHLLTPNQEIMNTGDPVEALDVSVLTRAVLQPILGIEDVRTDPNIDFVGGIRGTEELERLVMTGEAACAFSHFPVSVEELMSVADAGKIMAPKSTWFEPKLLSGLLVHRFGR